MAESRWMFSIEITQEAISDLKLLRKFQQQRVIEAIERQLTTQANKESRNRKRLRPNQLAEWELRVGDCRVFYDVIEELDIVKIVAVGFKVGNKLFVHGEEYEL